MPDAPAGNHAPVGGAPPLAGFRRLLVAVSEKHRREPLPPPVVDAARRDLGSVTLVHVVLRPTSAAANDADGSPANPEETAIVQDLRSSAVAALGEAGRQLTIRILHGDPGQRICEYADFLGADLVVLGPRAPGSFSKALKGSVSKYVVANSRRSLLLLGS